MNKSQTRVLNAAFTAQESDYVIEAQQFSVLICDEIRK